MPNFNPKYYSIFLLGLLFLEGCNKDAPPPVETKPIVNARIDRVYINEATISNKQIRIRPTHRFCNFSYIFYIQY